MKIGTINEEAEKILKSKKYRDMDPATVQDVLIQEFAGFKNKKQALKSARTKIHQVWADYLGSPLIAKQKIALAEAFASGSKQVVKDICLEILKTHKSTHERINILEEFYTCIFTQCGNVKIIIDLAAALNPFAIPWMPLPDNAQYHAYDINRQYIGFLNFYFDKIKLPCLAEQRDIYLHPPVITGDITFFFKMYHCLEKRKRKAGMEVLQQIKSRWIALTFPTRNLANRVTDITGNYEEDIYRYAEQQGWSIKRYKFATEELFLICCSPFADNKNNF